MLTVFGFVWPNSWWKRWFSFKILVPKNKPSRREPKKRSENTKTPKRLPFKYLKNSYRYAPDPSSNVLPSYILKVTRKIPLTWEESVDVEKSISEEFLVSILTYCHINYWNSDTRRSPNSAANWNSYDGLLCQEVLTFCGVNYRNLQERNCWR